MQSGKQAINLVVVRLFNPGMQSVAMQPIFLDALLLKYGPKQSLLSPNNHSFLKPEVTTKKLGKIRHCPEWNRNANSPSRNDNTNRDGMEIFLTNCFCNEKPAADQDINLGPIESTTSRVVSDRRSRCCSSFVLCSPLWFQLPGFQTKKIRPAG